MDGLTPQERRRRAILEGLSMNTSSSAAVTVSSTSARVSAPTRFAPAPLRQSNSTMLPSSRLTTAPKVPLSAVAPEEQALPELPTLNIKKRAKPWEDDFL